MFGKRLAGEKKAALKKVQFEFFAPEAREVFVAGEFNDWNVRANPLKKDKNGMWKLALPLMPGRYEYRFLTDGNWENDRSCSGCVPKHFLELAEQVSKKIKLERPNVKWKDSYALLGRYDVIDVVEASDPKEIEKVAMMIRAYGKSTTETLLASPWKEFLAGL